MVGLAHHIVRFCAGEHGNFAVTTALLMPVLFGAAALGVDYAALNHQKRSLQGAVDLAAIHAAGDPANAAARARAVLVDAGFVDPQTPLDALLGDNGPLAVTTGHYDADKEIAPAARFEPGGTGTNAVKIAYSTPGTLHFARTFFSGDMPVGAQALASATPRAGFSIGSRLASLDDGMLKALLGGLLGTTLELELMDYAALADLDIELLSFIDALAGEIDLEAGTYEQILTSDVALADITAAIGAAARDPAAPAVEALLALAGGMNADVIVDMARLVALDDLAMLGVGTAASGVAATVDALSLVTAAATLADGTHQVALDLTAGLPGLTSITAQLAVGEPAQGAWFALAGEGAYVRTAQVRLRLEFSLLGNGGGRLGLIGVTVPVYAELAPAEAYLAAVTCPPGDPSAAQAAIAARPGVLRLALGHTDASAFLDTRTPFTVSHGTLATVAGIARVTGRADVAMAQTVSHTLDFDAADAAAGTVKTVSTATPVASLTGSLLGTLDLELELLGINLLGGLLGGVTDVVAGMIDPLAPVIDNALVTVLNGIGIGLGEADIRVHGFDCRTATLVQ